jgi:hypothetical protein
MRYAAPSRQGEPSSSALQRIAFFSNRFGREHLYLAYHAALPLALTPDLLYRMRLWVNFQHDTRGEALAIPWVAVADLLLSNLCDEVGDELYEMKEDVRQVLLEALKADPRFTQKRIDDLSYFLLDYAEAQLPTDNRDTEDFALAQYWTVLVYTKPNIAAHELAVALAEMHHKGRSEIVRMASIVESFAEPLREFPMLRTYALSMASFVRGDIHDAVEQLGPVLGPEAKLRVAGVDLPVPATIQKELLSFQRPLRAPLRHPQIFQLATEAALEHCKNAIMMSEQVYLDYQRAHSQADYQLRDLRAKGRPEYDSDIQELKERMGIIQESIEHTKDLLQLLRDIYQQLEHENYLAVFSLTGNNLLRHPEDDLSQRVTPVVEQIAQTLRAALQAAVQFARELGQFDDEARNQAQHYLNNEVLHRYSDYPQARELQRDWERAAITQGVSEDNRAYEDLAHKIDALRNDFWSSDKERQARAVEHAQALPPEALLNSDGLERVRAAIDRFAKLCRPTDLELQQHEELIQERQLRRWQLRLRVALFGRDSTEFIHEIDYARQVNIPEPTLELLRHERLAIDAMYSALAYFDNGEWRLSLDAIRPARLFYPRAPRIEVLIQHLGDASQTEGHLEEQFHEISGNLLVLEHDAPTNDMLLKQTHQQLLGFNNIIEPYAFFKHKYQAEYQELIYRYNGCWRSYTERLLSNWRYRNEPTDRTIEQYMDMIAIAPQSEAFQSLIAHLSGRVQVIYAQQAISASQLNTAAEYLQTAAQLLPSEDQMLKDMQGLLKRKHEAVNLHRSLAVDYLAQHELDNAYKSTLRALAVDKEDRDALDLKDEIEARIGQVQQLARQAQEHEIHDLEHALRLWQDVCAQYWGGTYTDGITDSSFTIWRDNAQRRHDGAIKQIEQVYADFERLCLVLAGIPDPNWEEFNLYHERVRNGIMSVEPGMRHKLAKIDRAVILLSEYRFAYQRLDMLLNIRRPARPSNWQELRSQAMQLLQMTLSKMRQFDPGDSQIKQVLTTVVGTALDTINNEQIVQMLAAVVATSFDTINKLNRLIKP